MPMIDDLDAAIGQLFCCGWQGATPDEARAAGPQARALVEELRVGGLILMGRNLGAPGEVAALARDLQSLAHVPLWIGVDQEGGAVARFSQPGLAFPGNMALGATRSAPLAQAAAWAIGAQLAAMGINMNFAPTLDVNNNPANPIIGTRSFGEDPALVAELGVAAAEGYRAAGVVPVGKHFPGHGDTDVDSHLALPVQPAGRARLDAVELPPFRAAIAAGLPALMTTHILFPALDEALPATLSRRVLTGLLRDELGFTGVVITDCLEMEGIAAHWGPEEAAVLALEAGADLLLVCHTWKTQRRMVAAVRDAVRSGRLSEAHIHASVERLLELKRREGVLDAPRPDPAAAAVIVGAAVHQALERDVARAAVTCVTGEELLPLPPRSRVRVAGREAPAAQLAARLRQRGLQASEGGGEIETPGNRLVVLLDRRGFPRGFPERVTASVAPDRQIAVALREPYSLGPHPAACKLACYSDRSCALAALADVLAGVFAPSGRLPVTVSPAAERADS
jgi:beta-N-acetylhexosaminidase